MKTRLLLCVGVVALTSLVRAQQPQALLPDDEQAVTFKLQDRTGKTPHLVLFDAPDEAGTAESINYWRGTRDSKKDGVAVDFKAVRFLRSKDSQDDLIVRLVGIKNELELGDTISLAELQRGKPRKLHFGPAAIGLGPIYGTTDADMTLSYDPKTRMLIIPEISGEFEWKRPFFDAQKDAGSLQDVTGEIGEVPAGGTILKPAAKEAAPFSEKTFDNGSRRRIGRR